MENAEDLTHDCFLSLIKRVASFEPGRASLRTYLLAAIRNLWLKQLRTLGRESALDEFDENDFIAAGKAPLGRLLDDEMSLKVAEAVAALPPSQREALVLFEYEGISLNEIASYGWQRCWRGKGEVASRPATAKDSAATLFE